MLSEQKLVAGDAEIAGGNGVITPIQAQTRLPSTILPTVTQTRHAIHI